MRRVILVTVTVAVLVVAAAATFGIVRLRSSGHDRSADRPVGPFWVDSHSQAATQAELDPALLPIAAQPTALTLTGGSGDLASLVAAASESRAQHRTLVVMVYDIPHRDASAGYSAGGASSAAQYRTFTRDVAEVLDGGRSVIILEPDSLGQLDGLSAADQITRYALLNNAVAVYGALNDTVVYLDGTNSDWLSAPEMARRLRLAGVARAQGFAVNVSNFQPTVVEAARAEQVSALTGGAHYVVDTSRNGGAAPQQGQPTLANGAPSWCNPPDRRLGVSATTRTAYPHADAYLWVKHPGESDGSCAAGQPVAGAWFGSYARMLLGL